MKQNHILLGALIAIGLIIIVALFLWNSGDNSNTPTDTTNDSQFTIPETWREFFGQVTNDWLFSLNIPPEVEVTNPNENTYSLKYIGPESEPNTEITDGYLVTITAYEFTNIDEQVESINNKKSSVRIVDWNDRQAREFEATTELGTTVTHTIFLLEEDQESGTVIDLTTFISGDNSSGYNEEINNLLRSLQFTPAPSV